MIVRYALRMFSENPAFTLSFSLAGIVVGAAAAFGLARFISSFLFGVRPWDPAAFITNELST